MSKVFQDKQEEQNVAKVPRTAVTEVRGSELTIP